MLLLVKRWMRTTMLATLLALGPGLAVAAGDTPTAQVQYTVDAILALLKDKSLEAQVRRDKIRDLVYARFYFNAMSQRTLSRNWRKATPQQQDEFVSLFSKLLEKTYMGRIEAYTDERVEYLREKLDTDTRATVYTQIVTSTANIPIYYKLAKKGTDWLVYDVVIEEVSLISNYRSSYDEIIRKDGMDGLLKQMRDKVAEDEKA